MWGVLGGRQGVLPQEGGSPGSLPGVTARESAAPILGMHVSSRGPLHHRTPCQSLINQTEPVELPAVPWGWVGGGGRGGGVE